MYEIVTLGKKYSQINILPSLLKFIQNLLYDLRCQNHTNINIDIGTSRDVQVREDCFDN